MPTSWTKLLLGADDDLLPLRLSQVPDRESELPHQVQSASPLRDDSTTRTKTHTLFAPREDAVVPARPISGPLDANQTLHPSLDDSLQSSTPSVSIQVRVKDVGDAVGFRTEDEETRGRVVQ